MDLLTINVTFLPFFDQDHYHQHQLFLKRKSLANEAYKLRFSKCLCTVPLIKFSDVNCEQETALQGALVLAKNGRLELGKFSLGVTAEALRANIGSKSAISLQRWPVDSKFQVEGVAPHQPFFFAEN